MLRESAVAAYYEAQKQLEKTGPVRADIKHHAKEIEKLKNMLGIKQQTAR